MANPKRASMREGPLAALFRKTEGEDGEAAGETETEPTLAPEAATPRPPRRPIRARAACPTRR